MCCICKEKIKDEHIKDIVKLWIIVIKRGNIELLHITYNLKHSVPKKFFIDFHNNSNYDYDFNIKELLEEFERQFTCLGENTENA